MTNILDTVEPWKLSEAQKLIRDICEMDEPKEGAYAVMVDLDWLQTELEALIKQARREVLLEAAERFASIGTGAFGMAANELRRMAEGEK